MADLESELIRAREAIIGASNLLAGAIIYVSQTSALSAQGILRREIDSWNTPENILLAGTETSLDKPIS